MTGSGYRFLENLPLAICITDSAGEIVYVNNRFERWTGAERAVLTGRLLYDAFPDLNDGKYRNRLDQVLKGGPAAVFSSQLHPHMFQMPLPDGSLRIQNTTVNLFADDAGSQRMLIAVQDVTETVRHLQRIKDLRKQALDEVIERERAQAAQQKSEERYRSIFEHSPLGILQFDSSGDIISANQRVLEIFSLDRSRMVGRNVIDILPRDLLKLAQRSVYGESTHYEGTLFLADGEKKTWVEANFAPIRTAANTIDGVVGIIENVSERVEAQQELKQSQELLSSINRNIREGIYRSEPAAGLIYTNEAFARMLGVPSPSALYGRTVRSLFVDPDSHDRLEEKLSLTGSIINEEALLRRRDGSDFWVLMSVVATYGLNGEILWYDGAITDITDRKLDNERLRESEEQYRNLFQNSRAGMYRCDWRTGRMLKANRQALAILGYSDDDVIYTQELFRHPRDWKHMFAVLRRKGEFDGLEFEVTRRNGENAWISISAKLYADEGFFEGVVLDITQRKWAEKVQSVLYTVADKTSTSMPFKAYLNEIHEVLTHVISLENVVVARLDDADEFHYEFIRDEHLDEDHAAWSDHSWLRFALERGQVQLLLRPQIERLIREKTLNRTHRPIYSWIAAPIKAGARLIGVIAVCTYEPSRLLGHREKDVLTFVAHHVGTAMERRRNEDKMIEALELAQQASKTKSQFLANMSHELRTPLNSIIGYSRRLLKNRDQLSEPQAQALDVISRNAGSLLNMINDVLDLSRMEAGKMSFTIQKVDAADLVRQILMELDPLATQKSIYLKFQHAGKKLVLADPGRLRQVLINVIGNAIKFTDAGGVTVSLESVLQAGRRFTAIVVADTGVGIPEEKLRSIFHVFEQVNPEQDSARGGSGLGLAIAAKLTEEMEGAIDVTSAPGQGARFRVLIPEALENGADGEG